MISDMTGDEIREAREAYETRQLTLTQVRDLLVGLGYQSRSVNTIRDVLVRSGVKMRRPGRRRAVNL
jgi:hypothetical protein